ncbi:uncharacterized protein LOC119683621 [Teleopsis dalmanni]|uniref:uncharacterized protein LOC119678616 n=1 Tax=Teleopsis dalmanni TaxID=139649 RepID=UPI0018CF330B|nr:uncharacterized protein LOC119678616 [Teleopsis dalmanni]XP_037953334.1 uncharacterized protein LOC119683621 [Teleopsis dalmanni]
MVSKKKRRHMKKVEVGEYISPVVEDRATEIPNNGVVKTNGEGTKNNIKIGSNQINVNNKQNKAPELKTLTVSKREIGIQVTPPPHSQGREAERVAKYIKAIGRDPVLQKAIIWGKNEDKKFKAEDDESASGSSTLCDHNDVSTDDSQVICVLKPTGEKKHKETLIKLGPKTAKPPSRLKYAIELAQKELTSMYGHLTELHEIMKAKILQGEKMSEIPEALEFAEKRYEFENYQVLFKELVTANDK